MMPCSLDHRIPGACSDWPRPGTKGLFHACKGWMHNFITNPSTTEQSDATSIPSKGSIRQSEREKNRSHYLPPRLCSDSLPGVARGLAYYGVSP